MKELVAELVVDVKPVEEASQFCFSMTRLGQLEWTQRR
jgi:hypothetical protein